MGGKGREGEGREGKGRGGEERTSPLQILDPPLCFGAWLPVDVLCSHCNYAVLCSLGRGCSAL